MRQYVKIPISYYIGNAGEKVYDKELMQEQFQRELKALEESREEGDLVFNLLSIVEEFLKSKGVEISNDEKEGEDEEAILYGSDYYYLEEQFKELLEGLK